jgi:hypothetical protein
MPDGSLPGWPRGMPLELAAPYVGLGEAGWMGEVRGGRAPQPIYPTPRKPVWLREDLDLYLEVIAGRKPAVNWLDPKAMKKENPAEVGGGW